LQQNRHKADIPFVLLNVCFSNRPGEVKRFSGYRNSDGNVARGSCFSTESAQSGHSNWVSRCLLFGHCVCLLIKANIRSRGKLGDTAIETHWRRKKFQAIDARDLLKLFRGAFCKIRGQIENLINSEKHCETFTKHSSSDLTFFGIGWRSLAHGPFRDAAILEHWKSFLKPIVISSLSLIVAFCIAYLFFYCTALWIDS
jgi:hypothetical protein